MTPERAELLGELLTEVIEKDRRFIPGPAYNLVQKLVSWAAVELLLVRNQGEEVLLRYRHDAPWDGWHVIGGYVKPLETIQAFADRAVQEEKAGMTGVRHFKQIAITKWLDHPITYPFCALLVCEPVGEVIEWKDLKWFPIDSLPFGKMLHPKHELYLETYLKYLKHPERYCPIIGE